MITRYLAVFTLVVGLIQAQTTPVDPNPVFPGAVVTDAQLTNAVNSCQTVLANSIQAADTTMTLVAPNSCFVPYMLVTINNEIILLTQVSPGIVMVRGFDGTIPAIHAQYSVVAGFQVAWHHNAEKSEIEAIEQTLGPNLSNVVRSASVYNVLSYGAKGGARFCYDGVMSSSVNPTHLSSATCNFINTDVGKTVTVGGALSGPGVLVGTISSITSSTVAVLSIPATLSTTGARISIGTDDTAAFNAAVTAIKNAGGGTMYIPSGNYLLSEAPVTVYTGMGIVGDSPSTVSSNSNPPDYPPYTPNGGTWMDCAYQSGCFTGSNLLGMWFQNFGVLNWKTDAFLFGSSSTSGISNSWAKSIFGIGNSYTQGVSDTCWHTYNIEHFNTNSIFCGNVNVGWHGVAEGVSWSGFNSTWQSFYTYGYSKTAARGNNGEPEIWIEAIGQGLGSLSLINPQVNSYDGDGTGTHVLLEGEMGGYIHANIYNLDMEGADEYGVRCITCNNGSYGFLASGNDITYGISFDSTSDLNNVDSGSNLLTVQDLESPSTNNYVGQYDNGSFPVATMQGAYWDTGTTHGFVGAFSQAFTLRDLYVGVDVDSYGVQFDYSTSTLTMKSGSGYSTNAPWSFGSGTVTGSLSLDGLTSETTGVETITYNSPGNPAIIITETGSGVPVIELAGSSSQLWDLRVQGNDANEFSLLDRTNGSLRVLSSFPSDTDCIAVGRNATPSGNCTMLIKDGLVSTGATSVLIQYGAGQSSSSNILTVNAGATIDGPIVTPGLPSSAGSGGKYLCVDNMGVQYLKSSCP